MPMPTCPACGRVFGWKECFTFWNPWDSPCPHCGARLEASRHQKYFAYAVIPLGAFLAAVPLLLEAQGVWSKHQSLAFFAVVVPFLLAGALASWRYTRFTVKKPRGASKGGA